MVVLGQGAPNRMRTLKGRQGRCLCVWSEERGYCRVYPVPYGYVHDWDMVDFHVRMPKSDGRENTFVVLNYEEEWANLSHRIRKRGLLHRDAWIRLTRRLATDNFSDVRQNRRSFGLIRPTELKLELERNREMSEGQTLLSDIDHVIMDQKDYAFVPYVSYSCPCSVRHPHTSKLVAWEAYQFMRKDPDNLEHCKKLADNLHIGNADYEHYVLIGNMHRFPTSYIAVIRFKT
jgi:hypothetical protein